MTALRFVDLQRQYAGLKDRIHRQIDQVMDSSAFIMGEKVRELEETLGRFVGVRHAVGCSSGTDALLLAMMALDVRPGDEIITTPFSFIAAAEMIAFLGARPVFVDIDPQTYNLDPGKIQAAVTPRTKGIIPVDIFGQCADYDAINALAGQHGLFVIEDAAQAFGAAYKGRRTGGLATIGCTSFFPAKPFGCYGDGGMIFTDDDQLAGVMRSLLMHGAGQDRYDHVRLGINGRLDTLQAAVLLAKFDSYPDEILRRQAVADEYSRLLDDHATKPFIAPGNTSVYAQYSILVEDRSGLAAFLNENGIPTAVHYPKPLSGQPAFAALNYRPGDLPVCERICRNILALPMHPFLREEEQSMIIRFINRYLSNDHLARTAP